MTPARRALLDLTERLVHEHHDHPAGSVIRCVARCRDELVAMGVRDGLLEAVEAMARRRLLDRHAARVGGLLRARALVAVG